MPRCLSRRPWVAVLGLLPVLAACIPAPVREGERLYQVHCASCHGPSALGTDQTPPIHPQSRRHIVQAVRSPAGAMPSFSPQDLSDADLVKIAEFLLYIHQRFHPH